MILATCQCQHILCIHYWVEPSLLLSSSAKCSLACFTFIWSSVKTGTTNSNFLPSCWARRKSFEINIGNGETIFKNIEYVVLGLGETRRPSRYRNTATQLPPLIPTCCLGRNRTFKPDYMNIDKAAFQENWIWHQIQQAPLFEQFDLHIELTVLLELPLWPLTPGRVASIDFWQIISNLFDSLAGRSDFYWLLTFDSLLIFTALTFTSSCWSAYY